MMKIHELAEKFPNNAMIADDLGRPSVMVYIKKFYLDEVLDGALHIPHPAFVVNGKELDGIYISKFQNVILDGRWGQGLNAGVFKTCMDDPRSFSAEAVGFRSAYYEE